MRLMFTAHFCFTQWVFGLDFIHFPLWGTLYVGPWAVSWASS
jgi:hypothetical protein